MHIKHNISQTVGLRKLVLTCAPNNQPWGIKCDLNPNGHRSRSSVSVSVSVLKTQCLTNCWWWEVHFDIHPT